ncbi:hypothetical protein Eyrgjafa_gp_20 [Pelagibacter phage Eyrgjafa EXVC018P]|uniref:Chitin-binding type-3 domain-containing protein n=1 Tax=Pelagibacter phage Eyrgjafa EXVC018P TaxID=2736227 RepID=A0A7S5YAK3_9CAUD|nr:hypothetical protein Eyrgjafa_gp_20 [Pelagibacter phage Eyrgjafa EXVC018P]QLF88225.1 hypothetical protein Gjalp_gp33 [Pelagibacter phage Gjalp EXVC020P]
MATVNLGSIKFKWKGTYAGGTAYTIDDVVSYNGSSYICIQASTGNLPTNATYFEQMSQAGTDGTDLTSTLTTQGDIVYRDGSGLQRLGAGTSGQLLQSGGSGANVSWTDAPAGITSANIWRMTTPFTGSANPVSSNWAEAQYISSNRMTQSSGVFTFPSTGFWKISTGWSWYRNDDDRQCTVNIQTTEDNSSYLTKGSFDAFFQITQSNNTHTSAYGNIIFDVTNTTTHKVRIKIDTFTSLTNNYGESDKNRTYVEFTRLGDT